MIYKLFTESINKSKYKLLTPYINTYTKVKVECDKGHVYEVSPKNFANGARCRKCANKCPEQAKEQFIELIRNKGYILLSEYINNKTKVKLKCPFGHEYMVTPSKFKLVGRICPKCTNNCPNQAKDKFLLMVYEEGYELISEYKHTKSKVLLLCPNKHEYYVTPNNFRSHYARCPHCMGSTGQRKLQEMLEEYNLGNVIYNDRKVLGGLELDIYYPELNIAIEYQGNYWHNILDVIERDKKKKQLCEEKGIKLIEVWDDNFLKDNNKIVNELIKELV